MAGSGRLVLRPWIRELILGSETPSSPRAGQLLEVLQDAEAAVAGPSHAPDTSDVGATLLVSDGTHSVRCLVTREALDTSDWEEKEFGFRGTEGRLLLLQDCGVHVQVAEGGAVSGETALGGLPGMTLRDDSETPPSPRTPPARRVLSPGGPLQPAAHGAAPATGAWLVSDASALQQLSPPQPGRRWQTPMG
uniref:cDNA FLJ56639, highly similar to Adrenocortical dysplasia protein n=1 Tax=Homo sapiens TaxID=9606 RepID=B4DVI0_HUMAN|nr:unnamed protein product [Homo sapiens]